MKETADSEASPTMERAVDISGLHYRYGDLVALDGLDLLVQAGEVFAILGPNGSGKSTLFKILATLARPQEGEVRVFGHSVTSEQHSVRTSLGVVFQSPSLDGKLTVAENIRCQGILYGLYGTVLSQRLSEVAKQLGLNDRLNSKAETLSGGLKRRVELAKGILHKPRLLLMDEPSTGLDPSSRLDLWHTLMELQREEGITILLTTHLLEEAEKANRIGIFHQGKLVALGEPARLCAELGGQVLSIRGDCLDEVSQWLTANDIDFQLVENQVRVTGVGSAKHVVPLSEHFSGRSLSIVLGQPSLEDVFVAKTGHQYAGVRA